jgi:phosphopantothenoylcysteine synthetase/decarboxylase
MTTEMKQRTRKRDRPARVVLGVTGSIAAYKAAELVRLMVGRQWEVSVIMTKAATRFVGEITFRTLSRRPVAVDMFAEQDEWQPEHIALADWADAMLIAPCTANVMAKVACGIADDVLTAVALAARAPLILAPAMNEGMWENAATQANIAVLKGRGIGIVDVGTGDLACGYLGKGRMAAHDAILGAVEARLRTTERVVEA